MKVTQYVHAYLISVRYRGTLLLHSHSYSTWSHVNSVESEFGVGRNLV